jgi:hypothetical protein
MNKLVYSALALTLVSVPGIASENEWSSLDQEIESLSSSLSAQAMTGPKINGWVIASFRASSDEELGFTVDGETEDRQGFFLESARVEISGDVGSDYSYKLSFNLNDSDLSDPDADDFGSNTGLSVRDAYASARIVENVNLRMGRFKQPFLRSGIISDNRLLFLDRTILGDLFDRRDLGLMVFGNFDTIDWYIAAQNGADGAADEYLFTGRVVANLMGEGVGQVEGAFGAGDDTNLTIGASVADEGTLEDGLYWAIEAAFAQGPFSIAGEMVDFDEGDAGTGFGTGPLGNEFADTTPWSATASYMFTEQYEFAVRYQDLDDDDDSNAYGASVNRYVQGHDIKWVVQWQRLESDALGADGDELEVDEFALGLAVSF